jgi:hypothetical protein
MPGVVDTLRVIPPEPTATPFSSVCTKSNVNISSDDSLPLIVFCSTISDIIPGGYRRFDPVSFFRHGYCYPKRVAVVRPAVNIIAGHVF